MKGQVYKRCTKCPARARYGKGDRHCPECGAAVFSWYYKVDVGRTAEGKRLQEKRGGFETKEAAERALRQVLTKVDHDNFIESSERTLGEFLQREWLPVMQPPRLAETTWRDYRVNVTAYVVPHLGQVPLQELNAAHLNRMYADLLADGKVQDEGGLSPTTVRNIHVQLHKALEDAIKWGRLERNVTEQADPPSSRAVAARRKAAMTVWTADELRAFLEHVGDTRRYPLWRVAAYTGMRRSEVLGLRWQDVDFQRPSLTVNNAIVLVEDGQPIESSRNKTPASRRTIDLDDGTAEALWEHQEAQEQLREKAGPAWQETGLVFTNETGGCLYPNGIWQELVEGAEAAGVRRIRMHDLRHTHASLLLQAGVNPKVVSERLGHSSVAFTLDTYAHVMPGMQREAAETFEQFIDEANHHTDDSNSEGEDR